MRTWSAVVAGALVAVAAQAGGRAFAGLQGAPPSCAIAFIDMEKAINDNPKYKESQERLRNDKEAIQEKFTKMSADLRKRDQDIDARFSPGTPPYRAERKRIEMERQELMFDAKAAADELQRREVTDLHMVYQDVRQEAERIGADRGYSCVLDFRTEPLSAQDKGQTIGKPELLAKMATRSTIWARDDVDITKDVVEAIRARDGEKKDAEKKDGEKQDGEKK